MIGSIGLLGEVLTSSPEKRVQRWEIPSSSLWKAAEGAEEQEGDRPGVEGGEKDKKRQRDGDASPKEQKKTKDDKEDHRHEETEDVAVCSCSPPCLEEERQAKDEESKTLLSCESEGLANAWRRRIGRGGVGEGVDEQAREGYQGGATIRRTCASRSKVKDLSVECPWSSCIGEGERNEKPRKTTLSSARSRLSVVAKVKREESYEIRKDKLSPVKALCLLPNTVTVYTPYVSG